MNKVLLAVCYLALIFGAHGFQFVSQSNELQMIDGVIHNFNDLTFNCLPTDADIPQTVQVQTADGGTRNVTITCSKHSFLYTTSIIGYTYADTQLYQAVACRTTGSYRNNSALFANLTTQVSSQSRTLLELSWSSNTNVEDGEEILTGVGALLAPKSGWGALIGLGALGLYTFFGGNSGGIDGGTLAHLNSEIDSLQSTQALQLALQSKYDTELTKNENLVANALQSINDNLGQQQELNRQFRTAINSLNNQVGAVIDTQLELAKQMERNFNEVYEEQSVLFNEDTSLAKALNSTIEEVLDLATFVNKLSSAVENATNSIASTVYSNHVNSLQKIRSLSDLVLRVNNLLDVLASGSDLHFELNQQVQMQLAHIFDAGLTPFLPDFGYSGGTLFDDEIVMETMKIIGATDGVGNGNGVELSLEFACNTTGLLSLQTPFRTLTQFFPYMSETGCSITLGIKTCELLAPSTVDPITSLPPSERDPSFDSICTNINVSPLIKYTNVTEFAAYMLQFACIQQLKPGQQWLMMSYITQSAINVDLTAPNLKSPCETTFYSQLSGDSGFSLLYVLGQMASAAFIFTAPNLESYRDEVNGYMPNGMFWDTSRYYRDEQTGAKYTCEKTAMIAIDETSIVPVNEYRYAGESMTVTVEIEGEAEPIIYSSPVGTSEFATLLPAKMVISGDPVLENHVFDVPFTGTEASFNVEDRGAYYMIGSSTSTLGYSSWKQNNLVDFNPWFANNSPGKYRRAVDETTRKCTDQTEAFHGTLCQILNEFELASLNSSTVRFTSEGLTNAYQFTVRVPEGQVLVVETSNCPFVQATHTNTGVSVQLTNNLNGPLSCNVVIGGPCPIAYNGVTLPQRASVSLWVPSCPVGNGEQIMNVTTVGGGPCVNINVTTVLSPTAPVAGLASGGSVIIANAQITAQFANDLLAVGRGLVLLNLGLLQQQLITTHNTYVFGGLDLTSYRELLEQSSGLVDQFEDNARNAANQAKANMADLNQTLDEIDANLTAALAANAAVTGSLANMSALIAKIEEERNETQNDINQLRASNLVLDGFRWVALNLQNLSYQQTDDILGTIAYALNEERGNKHSSKMCHTLLGNIGGVSSAGFLGKFVCSVISFICFLVLAAILVGIAILIVKVLAKKGIKGCLGGCGCCSETYQSVPNK